MAGRSLEDTVEKDPGLSEEEKGRLKKIFEDDISCIKTLSQAMEFVSRLKRTVEDTKIRKRYEESEKERAVEKKGDDRKAYKDLYESGEKNNVKTIKENSEFLDSKGHIEGLDERYDVARRLCHKMLDYDTYEQIYTLALSILDHNIVENKYSDSDYANELIMYILQETNYSKSVIGLLSSIIAADE